MNAGPSQFVHQIHEEEFVQIWPMVTETVRWPPETRLDDRRLGEIVTGKLDYLPA